MSFDRAFKKSKKNSGNYERNFMEIVEDRHFERNLRMIILIDMMARPFVVAKKRKQMPVNEEHQVTKLPTTWVRAMKWLLHCEKL
jgi:hypothetical protein